MLDLLSRIAAQCFETLASLASSGMRLLCSRVRPHPEEVTNGSRELRAR